MFSGKMIAIAFVLMFASTGLLVISDKLKQQWLESIGIVSGLAASLYCVAAALFLWGDWQDPFATANIAAEDIGNAAAKGRGRGGIILLAIKFWPYVLGGFGAYFAYNNFWLLRYQIRSARKARFERAITAEAARLQSAHDSLGKSLEESATMMDELAEEFADSREIASRMREIAKDARD